MPIELVMLYNHLILCRYFLLWPSIFPSIRVFPMSWLFTSGGQSYWSFSISSMNIQDCFSLGFTGFISLESKGLSRVPSNTRLTASILQRSAFFMVQLPCPYTTTGKTVTMTIMDFCLQSDVSALFCHSFPSKEQAPFNFMVTAVTVHSDLEPKKVKSVTASTFSPSIHHEVMRPDAMIFIFLTFSSNQLFKPAFHSPLSLSPRGSLVPLHFLLLEWYHLHIWCCRYFSQHSWLQLVLHPDQHFTWCTLHIS